MTGRVHEAIQWLRARAESAATAGTESAATARTGDGIISNESGVADDASAGHITRGITDDVTDRATQRGTHADGRREPEGRT